MTLVLYSEKEPAKADTRVIDPKILQQIESQLFGVRPLDPATHVVVAVALAVAAGAASYVSARRGTALDPVIVLRGES